MPDSLFVSNLELPCSLSASRRAFDGWPVPGLMTAVFGILFISIAYALRRAVLVFSFLCGCRVVVESSQWQAPSLELIETTANHQFVSVLLARPGARLCDHRDLFVGLHHERVSAMLHQAQQHNL